ncbi:MAG: class I SAM-dependent methyltransferase [Dehalococcoidia bacterium]|nr:class I SAM-dependent methyltransferase [Dehalococcoidia bacterium]
MSSEQPLYPLGSFRREDTSDDELFYDYPRLVVHVDDDAVAAISKYLDTSLPHNSVILDLMSSWRSHLPENFSKQKLVGLGMNKVELAENPQLDERVIHNLNKNPQLPFADNTFDTAVVTVSVQYMTQPVAVFREVNRVLKPGASFHVIYSNRMFPTKAVLIWQLLNDEQHGDLIASYFKNSSGWDEPKILDASPKSSSYTDPVFVVTAAKSA